MLGGRRMAKKNRQDHHQVRLRMVALVHRVRKLEEKVADRPTPNQYRRCPS